MHNISAIRPQANPLTDAKNAAGKTSHSKFAEVLNAASNKADKADSTNKTDNPEFTEAFNTFVGQTFYGSMLKSMRKTVGKTPYFNGGMAEEMFTQQLDQMLAEKLGKISADKISAPMLKLYQLQQRT